MSEFQLHPTLAADTMQVANLALCSVLLMNDARYPWLILVPRRPGLRDLIDLSDQDGELINREIRHCSQVLQSATAPYKLNVAALGNMVEQLHVHIIARHKDDSAWPGPVWGVCWQNLDSVSWQSQRFVAPFRCTTITLKFTTTWHEY